MTVWYKKIIKRIPGLKNMLMELDELNQSTVEMQENNRILSIRIEELEEAVKKGKQEFDKRRQLVNEKIGEINVKSKRYDYCADKMGEIVPQVRKNESTMKELDQQLHGLSKQMASNNLCSLAAQKAANESVWSSIFHDTIWKSRWLINQKFSPGRWGVGYQYLYVLYRILDELEPGSILELGLGQSTKMITQYMEYKPEGKHIVVEHDSDWIEFYKKNNQLSSSSEIRQLSLCKKIVNEDEEVIAYDKFFEELNDRSYDLISIDAPFGVPANIYARADILELIPSCLSKDFVIMIDDYNRTGEKNTVELIKNKLEKSGIKHCTGIYSGNKDTLVITAQHLHFLTTL